MTVYWQYARLLEADCKQHASKPCLCRLLHECICTPGSQECLRVSHLLHSAQHDHDCVGGEILLGGGIQEAYETGNGHVTLRAKVHIEDERTAGTGPATKKRGASARGKRSRTATSSVAELDASDAAAASSNGTATPGGKALIVVTEMPYQVCKVSQKNSCMHDS